MRQGLPSSQRMGNLNIRGPFGVCTHLGTDVLHPTLAAIRLMRTLSNTVIMELSTTTVSSKIRELTDMLLPSAYL